MSGAKRPPTPDGVPLLGNGLAFSRDPFGSVAAWADEGDVVHLRFPGRSLYMVTGPDLVEQVLVEQQGKFTIGREQRETFDGFEDDAVTASTGDRWKRLRRALQPAFTWEGIQKYGTRMSRRTADHVARWESGDQLDLLEEMRLLTLRILGDTLLGVDIEGDEAVVLDAADALVDRADPRRFGQLLPGWVPTPTERRFDRAVGRLDEYVTSVLADRSPGSGDVESVLLAAHERGDLSTAEVRDNATALLLAGHDSSAVTLTYAWYELSRHASVREPVAAECESVVGNGLPGAEDFDALRKTRNVVRETLRLYPPAWAVNREATETVVLGEYEIPAGAQVMLPQWAVHRDDRFWEDPEAFDPSRWARDAERPEYAYFPFSGGPRHCVGMRFARLELVLALATMITRVDLDVSVTEPLTFSPSLSLRPETDVEAVVRRP
ncbi:cytochrome P450 [Halostella sp. JP-L12]|uniref:cytochrome P450 n=1 Tax=Halostella TaxID=1843185 RepID=UPI000EF78706|nr:MULTISPECIES: cytochrome P450 [Halostella]NHN47785.1 cytochrome P450 [Halostella sp. JP-L12]